MFYLSSVPVTPSLVTAEEVIEFCVMHAAKQRNDRHTCRRVYPKVSGLAAWS
jgi:hypothetical protein